ncbi:hypothetical protein RJ53_00410 [Methanocalculus chunghsingensis]|uniref:Uncharacterized protein n=1 Tax=Methanocalculus chunghsingensis TaxID=156457 RepID=A0A8J8B3C8_9EURY|nr:hypothetical protein [Methanocalculus chunghsingensis]MBR1368035.1 hypothetical protein [Methanocalculus chunghsingensis]
MKKAGLLIIILSVMVVTFVVLTSALPTQPDGKTISNGDIQEDRDQSPEDTFNLTSVLKKLFGRESGDEKRTNSSGYHEDIDISLTSAEVSDDDRFLRIIGEKTFSFHVLALHTIIALDQSDSVVVWNNAEKLESQAIEVCDEVETLSLQPSNLDRQQEFVQCMQDFIAISQSLQEGVPQTVPARREIIEKLSETTKRLHTVGSPADDMVQMEDSDDQVYHLTSLASVASPLRRPDDIIDCGSPYTYLDTKKSNEISLVPRYSRFASSLWYETVAGTKHQNAPPGKTYLFVFVHIVHMGNFDGKHYTIHTPAPSAYTLHGLHGTYKPLLTPTYTSLGEMYVQRTLNRKENYQSFLVFEVPDSLSLSDFYLSVFLGSEYGTVSWNIT